MALGRIKRGINAFLLYESSGGILLLMAALLAIAFANSGALSEWYTHTLHLKVGLSVGEGTYALSVHHWINDALMAVFFLLVGLEIKREFVEGELSVPSQAMLPFLAALGGMVVPAGIYAAFNAGDEIAMRGWAIPVATDIAFSLGVLSLLGSRAPIGLKVFLTAVAVIDDLLAITIIALFYTANIDFGALAAAGALLAVLFVMNRNRVDNLGAYVFVGAFLWLFVLQSGVHATLAGVATALAIPIKARGEGRSPLRIMEHKLHMPVAFLILPVFAFANAGVDFRELSLASLAEPIPAGIALGLLVGKIVGIFAVTFAVIRLGFANLPTGCNWMEVLAVSLLCGIGFTVSLFIGNLAFPAGMEENLNLVKLGVLAGSTCAGVLGFLALYFFLPAASPQAEGDSPGRA